MTKLELNSLVYMYKEARIIDCYAAKKNYKDVHSESIVQIQNKLWRDAPITREVAIWIVSRFTKKPLSPTPTTKVKLS